MYDVSKVVLSEDDICEKALANENGIVTRAVLTAYRIRKQRLLANIPQKDLAERIGVRKQTLHKYESAIITNIPSDKIEAIAKILEISPAYLMGWTAEPKQRPKINNLLDITPLKKKRYPLLGVVACGEPTIDEINEYFDFDDIDADFALKCKGDSMIGAHIYDGDIVLIKRCEIVDNGQIAAVAVDSDGECTLKKVYFDKEREQLTLMPCNPAYDPIIIHGTALNEVRIIGRAVGFFSKL